jgi:hypothetical protein
LNLYASYICDFYGNYFIIEAQVSAVGNYAKNLIMN